MNSVNKSESFESEIELDLTGEIDMNPTDQRSSDRQQTSTKSSSLNGTVECRNNTITVRIDDLSIKGVGVTMNSRLPLNEECKLSIQLAVCGSEYELTMKCRVRHCDAINSKTYHSGLQFIDMTQGTRDTLLLLIG
jgi:hypothetical protein